MARFVVCYDVSDNRRRRKIVDILDAYGARVQHSVFELVVSSSLMDRCTHEISLVLDDTDDRLVVYRLCASCDNERIYAGSAANEPRVGDENVFIV